MSMRLWMIMVVVYSEFDSAALLAVFIVLGIYGDLEAIECMYENRDISVI